MKLARERGRHGAGRGLSPAPLDASPRDRATWAAYGGPWAGSAMAAGLPALIRARRASTASLTAAAAAVVDMVFGMGAPKQDGSGPLSWASGPHAVRGGGELIG